MTAEVLQIDGVDRLGDRRVREVVIDLCRIIQARFPDAAFRTFTTLDYRGAIVEAYVDHAISEAFFPVTDPIIDHLTDLLVQEGIAIHLWPCDRDRLEAS